MINLTKTDCYIHLELPKPKLNYSELAILANLLYYQISQVMKVIQFDYIGKKIL